MARRLYSWLLGNSGSVTAGEEDLSFFENKTSPLVADAISALLLQDSMCDNSDAANRIVRLFLYLLDKGEIGVKVMEGSLFELLFHVAVKEIRQTDDVWRRSRIPSNSCHKEGDFPKNLNFLLNSLDPGFIWTYVGEQLTATNSSMSVCKVIQYLLGVIQLDSHSDIRSRQLPHLLSKLLKYAELHVKDIRMKTQSGIHQEVKEIFLVRDYLKMMSSLSPEKLKHYVYLHSTTKKKCFIFAVSDPVNNFRAFLFSRDLLREIQQASGAIELRDQDTKPHENQQDTAEVDSQGIGDNNSKSEKFISDTHLVGTAGQMIIEDCLTSYLGLLSQLLEFYLTVTDEHLISFEERREICNIGFALLQEFSEYPLCALLDTSSNKKEKFNSLPDWVNVLMKVCLGQWVSHRCADFSVEGKCLEVLLYMTVICHSVVEQCDVLNERRKADEVKGSETFRPVFLRPVLPTCSLQHMEQRLFFKNVAVRLWQQLGMEQSENNERAAALFSSLHTCQMHISGHSDAEMQCLKDLTSTDESMRCQAAGKFHRLWSLSRNNNEEVFPGVCQKPFSRVVLTLLSCLAGSHCARNMLEYSAWSWFEDCLQHGDAPKLLQILCLVLLQPNSSREFLNYPWKIFSRAARNLECLRSGSLRLYHLSESVTPMGDIQITESTCGGLADLKRQLLSGREIGSPVSSISSSDGNNFNRRWAMMSFDEDLESKFGESESNKGFLKENLANFA